MVYKVSNQTYDFRKFKTIRFFRNEIRNNIIDMDTTNDEQKQLATYVKNFMSKTKPQHLELKKKQHVLNSPCALINGREMVFKAFESGIFSKPKQSQQGERLKILISNQILKRLPIALARIKAGNNSESLLN